ncbi:MAG: endonuclease MutS2 [Dehalococcoidia bacterium]|nr:endonuclease MutS2 [Dehalococcoidia bacterium]
MDTNSLHMLEYPLVLKRLADHTSFAAGRELALTLQPTADAEHIRLLLRQSAEARRLLSVRPDFHIGEAHDVREDAARAGKGVALDPLTLLSIQKTLAACRIARNSLQKLCADLPALWGMARDITALPELEGEIGRCLSPSGEVLDSASAHLADVRRRLRDTRRELQDRLAQIVKSKRGQEMLQEQLVTERNGRYVLPVRVEAKRELKGIVHDVSNTGATVFIEPMETIESGNELRQLEVEERQEIERILMALSASVGDACGDIELNIGILARLDLALAKALFAEKIRAIEPEIVSDTGERFLRMVNARHPLLRGEAVPLSVELGRDFSVLIISGPNAGGKTVALKTIGLLVLMTQAGLPIPCSDGTRLPVYDEVYADIGDEQSIEQTLSTFSAHISNVARIVKKSTPASLALLDELGISTDPGEGAALAQATLAHFVNKKTNVVVTTHYSEIKAFAHLNKGLRNASLDFDPVTLMPTYRLSVGMPGGSNALNIACRFGLPDEIVDQARSIMSKGSQEVEAMMVDLAAERKRLAEAQLSIDREKARAAELSIALEAEISRIRSKEREMVREIQDNLNTGIAGLYREIREAENELKKQRKKESLERARKALEKITKQTEKQSAQLDRRLSDISEGQSDVEKISVGDSIRLKDMNTAATVVSVDEGQGRLEALVGDIKLTLRLDGVEKIDAPASGDFAERVEARPRTIRTAAPELDLRGQRAEMVESTLDSYLNDAFMSQLPEVRIIHGYGTGAVKGAVREALATHALVKSFRPGGRGQGGDGVTIVELT